MKIKIVPWLSVLVFGIMVSAASAQVRHVDIPTSNLTTHASRTEGEGPYYVLTVALPTEIRVVRQAWLELRAAARDVALRWSGPEMARRLLYLYRRLVATEPRQATANKARSLPGT